MTNNRVPPLSEPLRLLGEPDVKLSLQKQGPCFTVILHLPSIWDTWTRWEHCSTTAAHAAHSTNANELPRP